MENTNSQQACIFNDFKDILKKVNFDIKNLDIVNCCALLDQITQNLFNV